ncbi:MAG: hypothetical protein CML66_08995 [Rhodobacteraceae bacterium]|nr:hypothetical protein [Paracoccaceae bacterium]
MAIVSVIGAGRIGRQVIDHIDGAPGLRPGRVLTRTGAPDTADPGVFLSAPCDIIIETAGPAALRAHGAACLRVADLWTVSAAALVDDAFRDDLFDVARRSGTSLRLFAPWVAGIGQVPPGAATALTLRIARPGAGGDFTGSLRDAARAFPNELNFAVAAALCGPGLDATRVEIRDAAPHLLEAELETRIGTFRSSSAFTGQGGHPTAQSLVAALDGLQPGVSYGA